MKRIETEYWKPHPEKQGYSVFDKGRPVQEVYSELRARLEAAGYLPDEYFMLDHEWENGREWPQDGDIFCTVDYGGSEGIYLDVYLKYQDEENERYNTDHFITGKTLGESDADMDRMFLIASAVTKAFHSDGVHARYIVVGGQQQPEENAVFHLDGAERKIVADSLLDTRARLKEEQGPFEAVEKLLRRIIGSISEYVRIVGDRPKWLDDYDRAALAVQDGDPEALRAVLSKVAPAYGSLLIAAAERPGADGMAMTEMICAAATNIDYEAYLRACRGAVEANDTDKVLFMLSKVNDCVADVKPEFYGEVIARAVSFDNEKTGGRKTRLAAAITESCTPEQIRAANPYLLRAAIMSDDRRLINALLDRKIPVTDEPAMLIHAAAMKKDVYLAERLIQAGADVNGQSHAALYAAMRANDHTAGMFLLKLGADFTAFSNTAIDGHSAGVHKLSDNDRAFLFTLKNYYESSIKAPEVETETGSVFEKLSAPVGRIDYLGPNGTVGESIEYTDAAKLERDIKRENYYGAPMTVTLYRDEAGNTVPHDYIFDTDPPLQGFKISDYDPSQAADAGNDDAEDDYEMEP